MSENSALHELVQSDVKTTVSFDTIMMQTLI